MISSIISITFLVLAIVAVLIGLLKARKQHWVEAVIRVVFTVISAILTVILTSAFATKISESLIVPIENLLASTPVDDILKEVASAEGALSIILSIVITPIFFILVFVVIKGLLSLIFARLLAKAILKLAGTARGKDYLSDAYPSKKEKKADENEESNGEPKKKSHCIKASIIGAICALLSFTILLVPVAGTMETVSSIAVNFEERGDIHDVGVALNDNVAAKLMLPIAAPIWDKFNHYTINGDEINIAEEAHLVGVIMKALGEVSSSDTDTIHHSAEIFREMSALCPNSSLVPCLCADFLNAASAHWLEGENFYGIALPATEDQTTKDLLTMFITCLDHSSTETMREDLVTIANVMAIIADNATVDEEGVIDMSSLFENDRVIAKLSVELLSSKRLAPVMSTLVKKQIETSGGQLELPDKESDEYKVMVDTLVDKYQENFTEEISEESLDSLADAVGTTVEAEAGIVLSESEKVAIASTFISEFGGATEITSDMVSNFIEQYRKQ
ncbi:MAG: hypothetical protein IKB02_03115 [Clostridia bacterium]|nr:hypothetical protein [Clostridia bacterium]